MINYSQYCLEVANSAVADLWSISGEVAVETSNRKRKTTNSSGSKTLIVQ